MLNVCLSTFLCRNRNKDLFEVNRNIIEGLRRDDSEAMKRLFDLYYVLLCGYAKRYVFDTASAEEIVSDVMYKIWQNRHAPYRADTFREYMFTATRNTALNYLKQKQNQRIHVDTWAEQLRYELIDETPLDMLVLSELQSNFDGLMDTLPEQCRKAYRLSRVEGLTYEEIAEELNISINTVKHHIKTALQKLRIGLSDFLIWILLLSDFIF